MQLKTTFFFCRVFGALALFVLFLYPSLPLLHQLTPIKAQKNQKSTDKSKLFSMYSSNGNKFSISFAIHAYFFALFFMFHVSMLIQWAPDRTYLGFLRLQQMHTAKTDTKVANETPEMIRIVNRSSDGSIVKYIELLFLLNFRKFSFFSTNFLVKFYRFWREGFYPFWHRQPNR